MRGQIIARGERTWLARVFLGRDANGKRRYHNHTIHGTKKDAQAYLTAVLRDMDLGTYVEPAPTTLRAYLERWLTDAAKTKVRARTHADYGNLLNRYVTPVLGERRLGDLTALDVQRLYAGMTARGLSARTVRYTHAVLSSALKQAVRWGLIPRNVATLVNLPRQERQEMRCLSPEQAARFLQAAKADRWGVLFEFALVTGMRPSEYLALKWGDLDLVASTATVRRSLARINDGWRFDEPKTPKSRRTMPLPAATTRSLAAHKAHQDAVRSRAGRAWRDLDLVFASDGGQPLDLRNLVQRHFKPLLKAADLADLRLYDLRHTCATLLLAAGINPKVVAERLGHSSVMLTMDVYSHVLPTMQAEATGRLEALLYPKPAAGAHRQPKPRARQSPQRQSTGRPRRSDMDRGTERGS